MAVEQIKDDQGNVVVLEDGANPVTGEQVAESEQPAHFRLIDILQGRVQVTSEIRLAPLTLNDLAELEDAFGDLNQLEKAVNGSIKDLRKMMHILCKREEPNITEQEVGAMIDVESIGKVQGALQRIMTPAGNSPSIQPNASK